MRGAAYGEGAGTILLDDLNCDGTEQTLLNCSRRTQLNDCTHSEDAGVKCEGKYTFFLVTFKCGV